MDWLINKQKSFIKLGMVEYYNPNWGEKGPMFKASLNRTS